MRWLALHTDYRVNELFVDEQIAGPFASWVHRHEFEALGPHTTRLTDRVTFQLPGGPLVNALFGRLVAWSLIPMFRFRHRATAQACESRRGMTRYNAARSHHRRRILMRQCLQAVLLIALALAALPSTAHAQAAPRNDLPQPYRTTRDWGQLPPGVKWAAVTAIEPAPDGTIFVVHRCVDNSCEGRTEPPILVFDKTGQAAAQLRPGAVQLPARRHGRSRRQSLDDRRARRQRHRPPGHQAESAMARC